MKLFLNLFILTFTIAIKSHSQVSIGVHTTLDLNCFDNFNGKPRDDQAVLGIYPGLSFGLLADLNLHSRVFCQIGADFTRKVWYPQRDVTPATLNRGEMRAFEFPLRFFFRIKEAEKLSWKPGINFGSGIVFQKETYFAVTYGQITNTSTFYGPYNYWLPDWCLGLDFQPYNKYKFLTNLGFRFGRGHHEFLNRYKDKFYLDFIFLYRL